MWRWSATTSHSTAHIAPLQRSHCGRWQCPAASGTAQAQHSSQSDPPVSAAAGSSLAVFDSQDEEVPQMTGIFAASPLSSRRLQGYLSQSPSSSQALQSPQSSASAVACSDRAWSLSLQPGANQFLLLVTAPGAAVSPAQLNASADIILVSLPQDCAPGSPSTGLRLPAARTLRVAEPVVDHTAVSCCQPGCVRGRGLRAGW